jgi:hypothetical protein
MLDRTSPTPLDSAASYPGQPGFSSVRVITAKAFKRVLRRNDPTELALLAYDLSVGNVIPDGMPVHAACGSTGASAANVYALRNMTIGQRADVRAGCAKIAHVMAAKAHAAKCDKAVKELGANAMMAALDRVTAPTFF